MAWRTPRSDPRNTSGWHRPAHHDVVGGPRTDALERRAATSGRARDRHRGRARPCRRRRRRPIGEACRAASRRHRERGVRRRRRRVRPRGNTWVRSGSSSSSRWPTDGSTIRDVTVRAPATDTCWPTTARTLGLERIDAARRIDGPAGRRPASPSAVRSTGRRRPLRGRRRDRAGGGSVARRRPGRSTTPGGRRRRRGRSPPATRSHRDRPGGRSDRRYVGAVPRFDARECPLAEERQHVVAGERLPRRQAERHRRRSGSATHPCCVRPARDPTWRGRVRRSVGDVAKTSRIVSLNWRTLPKPAANATSVSDRSVVSISSRAVWARCARAMASGPAPSSSVISRLRWRSL